MALGLASALPFARNWRSEQTPPVPKALLLDTYPGAAVAYSTRRLSVNYTGAALRVRRSSDNVELDIGFLDDVLDTAQLRAFTGNSVSFVTTWYDQTGNTRNAVQPERADQPRIMFGTTIYNVNGRPAIATTSYGTEAMRALAVAIPQPVTVFAVAQLDSNATLIDSTDTTKAFALYAAVGNARLDAGASIGLGGMTGVRNYYGLFSGASSQIGTNTLTPVTGNAGANALNGLSLFASRNGASVFGTKIAEVILYGADKSALRTAITADAATAFGVTN